MELYIGHCYNFRLKDRGGDGGGSACRIGSNKCILKSRDYMKKKSHHQTTNSFPGKSISNYSLKVQ